MAKFESGSESGNQDSSEFSQRFLEEVCGLIGEAFVLGAAFQARYRMILYEEPHLFSRSRLRAPIPRALDIFYSIGLALLGANAALFRGPWLLRRYRIETDVTPIQYAGLAALFSVIPWLVFAPLTLWIWALPVTALCVNFALSRLVWRPGDEDIPAEPKLLARLWEAQRRDEKATKIAPGLSGYFAHMRLVCTGAWLARQSRLLFKCLEELSAILDQSSALDLCEECVAAASKSAYSVNFKELDHTRLAIRRAAVQLSRGSLETAEQTLKSVPSLDPKDDATTRWAAYRDLTEARLHQERLAFGKALDALESARVALRVRLSKGSFFSGKTKAHHAALFAHAAEQRILILSVLSRFDEASEAANADAEVISQYGDRLGTLYFQALAAYMRALAGVDCSEAEAALLEQRLGEAEQAIRGALDRDEPEGRPGEEGREEGNLLQPVMRLLNPRRRMLSSGGSIVQYQHAASVIAVVCAHSGLVDYSLRCIDGLERMQSGVSTTFALPTEILRAVAYASGGHNVWALESASKEPETESIPFLGPLSRAVLRAAVRWNEGQRRSAAAELRDSAGPIHEIRVRYAAIDVRVALAATGEKTSPAPAEVTVFPSLFGPIAFLWEIGTALIELEQGHTPDAADHLDRGLQWLEDRRIFVETPASAERFKTRYGWLYDLTIESLLKLRRYDDAVRDMEAMRCMTLLVLSHYQALDLSEVDHPVLWKNYLRIIRHVDELVEIARRQRMSDPDDPWQKFLDTFFTGWTAETAEAELDRLAGELDRILANLRRAHPRFRQLQAALSPRLETIPRLEATRAILYYHFDSRGNLWIILIRSNRDVRSTVIPVSGNREDACALFSGWVGAYLEMLQKEEVPRNDIAAESASLSKMLIDPVSPQLTDADDICVVPHGPLFDLPFHALVVEGQYAVWRWSFSYLPSLAFVWQALVPSTAQERKALAVIDPDTEGEWPQLGSGRSELDVLMKHFQVEVQEGTRATKKAFRREAHRFPFLHLTAHSKADPERGLAGYIRFAGAPETDCRLHPHEVLALHLDCHLCNLSSCQSGLLCVTKLGEIEGLATSFLVAGTRHVVSALWNVRDEFGPSLMDLFYAGPFMNKPGAALSEAQRHWASQEGPFAHPKFWAPFYAVERFEASIISADLSGLYIV